MKPTLRLLKSPEEEKAIFIKKEQEANRLLSALITQSICFKKLKDFEIISQFYKNFQKNQDVNTYLENLEKFKYLFELGTPGESDIKIVKLAMAQIQLLGNVTFSTPEQKDLSKMISRLLFRTALFKMPKELQELSTIASHFRAFKSTIIIKADLQKFLPLLNVNQ